MKSPEQEAEEYDRMNMLGCVDEASRASPAIVEFTRRISKQAHLAGQESMKARILGMLRSEEASEAELDRYPHLDCRLTQDEWADWLESVLKEEK